MGEYGGVAPSFSRGLRGASLAPRPRSGRPREAGARGSLAEEGTPGRGVRRAFPSLLLRAVSGGAPQSWRVPGDARRAGPALRPSSAAEGTAAPLGSGAEGRGEAGPLASPSLGGVTGSRGLRGAGERPSAGGAERVGEGGWSWAFRRGVRGGEENEWRLPVGIEGSPGPCVSGGMCRTRVPRCGCACGCLIDGRKQLP